MENYDRVEKSSDVTCYYLNGKFHRIDGPAREYKDGSKIWYKNGKRHRIGGPAEEYSNGDKWWWQNGELYRIDGPAIEFPNGRKSWYYEGKKINCTSQEEFKRYLKLKIFW
jgi:hypothetical protein